MKIIAIAALAGLALVVPAQAQMFGELRGGLYAHGVDQAGTDLLSAERLRDVNLEFVFKPLVDLSFAGSLHPVVGVTANFGGQESFGYVGANWRIPVMVTPVFVEAGLGGALGSSALGMMPSSQNPVAAPGQVQQLGCAVMWHAEGSVGVALTDIADVMLTAERYQPINSCSTTPGFTNVGVRVGFSF